MTGCENVAHKYNIVKFDILLLPFFIYDKTDVSQQVYTMYSR